MTPRDFRHTAFFGLESRQSASRHATRALVAAFHDTADLLLRPVDAGRWLKLSVLCLLLGGGTPSAAFNWGLVAGKTQTYLPWDSWQQPYITREPKEWFHEIFHADGAPYRLSEVDFIRTITGTSASPP